MNKLELKSKVFSRLTDIGAVYGVIVVSSMSFYSDATLVTGLVVVVILGGVIGVVLGSIVKNSHSVGLFAALYTYVAYVLLSVTTLIHPVVHIVLTAIASVALFHSSDWFFNKFTKGKTKKVIIASSMFVVSLVSTVLLNNYIFRLAYSWGV